MFLATAAAAACVVVLGSVGWRSDFVRTDRAPIDYVGTVSAMAGLSLVVLTLLEGNHWGWSSPRTIGCLLVGFTLVSFVIVRSRTQADPTVPLDLFRNRNFALSAAIGFTSSMMFYGMWLALLSYATDVWDQGLIRTGLMLTLMPGTMLFFARAAGRAADAHGYRGVMMTGTTIFCAGFTTFALTASQDTNNLLLLPAVISAGIAMATVVSNATSVDAHPGADGRRYRNRHLADLPPRRWVLGVGTGRRSARNRTDRRAGNESPTNLGPRRSRRHRPRALLVAVFDNDAEFSDGCGTSASRSAGSGALESWNSDPADEAPRQSRPTAMNSPIATCSVARRASTSDCTASIA